MLVDITAILFAGHYFLDLALPRGFCPLFTRISIYASCRKVSSLFSTKKSIMARVFAARFERLG